MATMNVSLPKQMKEWVEAQAETGQYANASDYVRDLIRRDRRRAEAVEELNRIVDDAWASGISKRTPEQLRKYASDEADKAMRQHGLADDRVG